MTSKNSLIILDKSAQFDDFEKLLSSNRKIIAVDFETHQKLEDENIFHEFLDNYLKQNQRKELYDHVLTKYNWYPPLGNLYDESFYDIWHGQEREKQSRQLLDKDYCRKWCPECRLTKYNVLLDKTLGIKTTNFI